MTTPVTFAICGCGSRGLEAYAPYQELHPERMRIVAGADSRPERLAMLRERYGLAEDRCFASDEELLAPPRRARPTGHPRRGGCRVSVPTRPGMNKSPNSAPTRPRTGGSPGNVPTPPRRNHAPSSIEARRNADGPLSALMGNALLMPLIR